MAIEINENDFKEDAEYSTNTVSYLLEEMQTRLPNNVFLLNKIHRDGVSISEAPYIRPNGNRLESSLGSYLEQAPNQTSTIASVINVEENHYISAIFKQENDVKTLVIHDPLGESDKTGGYNAYAKKIEEEFKEKFGKDISVEINPKNSVLYQTDNNSCGPVCIENLERTLNNKKLKEDTKLGITKDTNGEFICEENASSLRTHQLKKLQDLKNTEELVDKFMGGENIISADELVENIFKSTHDSNIKNIMLNELLDKGMIEGQSNLSKAEIVKALHNPRKIENHSNYDVEMSSNVTPPPTPHVVAGSKKEIGMKR